MNAGFVGKQLLYRASRDGWKASDFHACCDGSGATVTVIKSVDGFVFGGFADTSWHNNNDLSYGRYIPSESGRAFLFALRSAHPEYLIVANTSKSLYRHMIKLIILTGTLPIFQYACSCMDNDTYWPE